MPIELTNLSELAPADVQANLAVATQQVQEDNPTLDLRRGVIHDIVLYPHAALDTMLRTALARYLSARSLNDIQADPTLADAGVVDGVLSNFNIVRGQGATAIGEVTIVLASALSVTIGSGTIFQANGQTYTSDAAYTAKTQAAQINNTTDRLLTAQDDGTWAFTINVTATAIGTAGIIAKNTLITPVAVPTGYVNSYATNDFTGGLDAQTNDQLLAILQQGIAAKAPSNRINMQAMLQNNTNFARVLRSSIVGCGDEEMIRDQHTIWPGSIGGRCDWYVRTQSRVLQLTLTVTATLLSVDAGNTGTWQFAFGRNDAPAYYEIASILRPTSDAQIGTLTILSEVRGLDLSGAGFVPDIATVVEGAYTRFQTAVVLFNDTVDSGVVVGNTASYNVTVRQMPQIDLIQDYISSFNIRSYGADVLIKAPVPCFMSVSFNINKDRTQNDPDTDAIASAVADAVNNTDFLGRLFASQLHDVIQGFLPAGMSAGALDMFGRVRFPDGTIKYVRNPEVLSIDDIANQGSMVSSRTVAFCLDPADVSIAVLADIPLPQ